MLTIIISILLIICFSAIIYYIFREPDYRYRWFIITYQDSSTGEIKTYEGGLRCVKKDCIKHVKDKFLERYRHRGVNYTDIVQIKEVSIDEIRLHLLLKSSDGKQILLVPW